MVYRIKKYGNQRHEDMLIGGGHLRLLWRAYPLAIILHPHPLCVFLIVNWFLSNSSLHVAGTIAANSSICILPAYKPSGKRSSHLMSTNALAFLGSLAHSWNGLPGFTMPGSFSLSLVGMLEQDVETNSD